MRFVSFQKKDKIIGFHYFIYFYNKYTMKQVVRCFLRNDQNKFLMVKHCQSSNWTLPGWHIENWETLHQALEREIKEEFNFDIKIIGKKIWINRENINEYPLPLSIYKIEYTSNKWWKLQKMEYIFLAKIIWWKIKIQKEEIDDYNFFSKKEILNLDNTFPQIKKILWQL